MYYSLANNNQKQIVFITEQTFDSLFASALHMSRILLVLLRLHAALHAVEVVVLLPDISLLTYFKDGTILISQNSARIDESPHVMRHIVRGSSRK